MAFEPVEKRATGTSQVGITVYQDGTARLTAAATRAIGSPPAVRLQVGTGEDAGKLAFVASDAEEHNAFKISRDEGEDGGDVATRKTLAADAGVNVEAVEESVRLDTEVEGDTIIADLSPLPGIDAGDGDGAETDSDEADADTDTDEPESDDVDARTNGHDEPDEPADTPDTGDEPWTDADRGIDERIQLWVEAMVGQLGVVETTTSDINDQIGADAHGNTILAVLRDLDGYECTDHGETDIGQTVWRISETSSVVESTVADGEDDEGEADDHDEDADEDTDSTDTDAEAGVEDVVDLSQHTIPVQSRSLDDVEDVPADEVVEAIAGAPNVYRLQGALGCDSDAAEGVLHEIDLYDRFDAAAPLRVGEVRETVKRYLEVAV